MNNAIITDILGNTNIKNTTPFIIINTSYPHKFVKLINKNNDGYIFRFIPKNINHILKNNNLNSKDYVHCGDLFYKNKIIKNSNFLLVNKKYVKETEDFIIVTKTNNGYIYSPKPQDEYLPISLIYSSKLFKLKKSYIIKYDLIKKSSLNCNTKLCKMNFFNYLGSSYTTNYTINKKKIININKIPKHSINGEISTFSSLITNNNDIISNDKESNDSWIDKKINNVILIKSKTPWFKKKNIMSSNINTKNYSLQNNNKQKNIINYKTPKYNLNNSKINNPIHKFINYMHFIMVIIILYILMYCLIKTTKQLYL